MLRSSAPSQPAGQASSPEDLGDGLEEVDAENTTVESMELVRIS